MSGTIREQSFSGVVSVDDQRVYVQKVYAWMVGGLLTTGVTAWFVANTPALLAAIVGTPLFYLFLFAPVIMVWVLAARVDRMKASTAVGIFFAYALTNGLTFSLLFLVYDLGSIAQVFAITAGMYGVTAAYGYLTKRDLTGVGGFMSMGLIGLIIAMVVNMFLSSPFVDWAISIIGVIVFTGLTAYDMQRIKKDYVLQYEGQSVATKGAIMGALSLYLDFVNLFLFLLRLLGNRR